MLLSTERGNQITTVAARRFRRWTRQGNNSLRRLLELASSKHEYPTTTATYLVETAARAPATVAGVPIKAAKVEYKRGRYITVWLPNEKAQPFRHRTAGGECTLHFINCVSVRVNKQW